MGPGEGMTSSGFEIRDAGPFVPDRLVALLEDSQREGIRIVSTVVERWRDGTERFAGPGEALLVAVAGGEAVGIAGLSRCPDVAGALRVRRTYVSPAWRRRGVARALAAELVRRGFVHTDTITCNAQASSAAAPFWESVGFEPVDVPGITHLLRRRVAVRAAGRRRSR